MEENGVDIIGANDSTFTPTLGQVVDGDIITVTVSLTGDFACTFTSSGTILDIEDNPVAVLNNDAGLNTICAGSTIVFTANPIAGATYQFKLNGGNVPAGDVSGNVYTTNSITSQSTVTVLITNALGCSDTATNTILVPLVSDPGSINPPVDILRN